MYVWNEHLNNLEFLHIVKEVGAEVMTMSVTVHHKPLHPHVHQMRRGEVLEPFHRLQLPGVCGVIHDGKGPGELPAVKQLLRQCIQLAQAAQCDALV